MKKQILALAIVISSAALVTSCAVDTVNNAAYGPDYPTYTATPGYTSYMVYYGGQPNYWGYQDAYYPGVGVGSIGGYYGGAGGWGGGWGHGGWGRGGWAHGGGHHGGRR